MNVLSNSFSIRYLEDRKEIEISAVEGTRVTVLFCISQQTLGEMTFAQASQFLGERVLLLIPEFRRVFDDYLWHDGNPPEP